MRLKLEILGMTLTLVAASAAAQNTFPSSGNVGIGTTAPANPFVVYNSTYSSGFGVEAGCDSVNKVCLTGNNGGSRYIVIDDANKAIQFWTNNAQQVTLNSAGNVGIGTTNPLGILDLVNGSNQHLTFLANEALIGNWPPVSQATTYTIQSSGSSAGNLALATGNSEVVRLTAGGNVGIGTTTPAAKLEVNGGLRFSSDAGGVVQTTAWTGVLCGGDYAESVDVTGDRSKYAPGDVLIIDPNDQGKFLKSAEPYSTFVTGIYSTKPGLLGRRQGVRQSPEEVPMAMTGIVPTKVTAENGAIRPGDLLVTSSKVGYAMKGSDRNRMLGAVIGKALGNLNSGTGVIEVVVTLQ